MKKTTSTIILILALLFLVEAQVATVLANPMWPSPYDAPGITAISPVPGGTYPQNSVWLNLTVTKPSNWTDVEGQLEYVAYLIDGNRSNLIDAFYYGSCGETRIPIEDPVGVVNPPLEFNISRKLAGLSVGIHHIDVQAVGIVNGGPNGRTLDYTIYFHVADESSLSPTPSPTQDIGLEFFAPQQIAVLSGTTAVVCIVSLAFYFKKRQRGQSP